MLQTWMTPIVTLSLIRPCAAAQYPSSSCVSFGLDTKILERILVATDQCVSIAVIGKFRFLGAAIVRVTAA